MNKTEPYYVLGLTPDISSCGFALLDRNNQEICEMGSHLFKAPVDNKTKTSLAAARRLARSARRNNLRNKNRQKHCLQLLKEYGLVPSEADKEWMQTKKGDKPTIRLRKKALDHSLTGRELAQVLYALSGHRGYIDHGTGDVDEVDASQLNSEDGKVLKAIKENRELMAAGGYRTVGEMLYTEGTSRNKQKRGDGFRISVLNSQLVDEVKTIFEAQEKLENSLVSHDFLNDYLAIMQWEKKSLDHDQRVYQQVETCRYFDDQKRAAKATVSSQLCCGYERFGRIVIIREDGSEQYLTSQQTDQYLSILFSPQPLKGNASCKVTYKTIRNDLDLPTTSFFKGVDTEDEKTAEPFAPKGWRVLRKSNLPEDLMARMLTDRAFGDTIGSALTYASTEDSLRHQLEAIDLTDEEIKRLCQTPFAGKTFSGYDERSLKALGLLLDSFEGSEICTLSDAEKESGLHGLRINKRTDRYDLLPAYQVYDPACTNHVTLHAMARMRRIVNAIIRLYGVPNEIHIALGSELKQPVKEKRKIARAKRATERANKVFRAEAAAYLGCEEDLVAGKILRKMALYEEQNQRDIFTDAVIDKKRMICDDTYCKIVHVLPYLRTCDDSQANKVLVLAKTKKEKDNLTPYEWMTQKEGSPDWEAYRERIMATVASSKKKRYLLDTTLGEDDNEERFIDRNLNDTRYTSRMIKDYMEQSLAFSGDGRIRHVVAVSGGVAANYRYFWGLNRKAGKTKDRDDASDHAVAACVTAGLSKSVIRKTADVRNQGIETFKRLRKANLTETQPWSSFGEEVANRREEVIPTFAIDYGVTGQLFESTLYHLDGINDKDYPIIRANGKSKVQGNIRFVTDSSLQLVGGMAFVRLWLDPTERPNGKGIGRYYAEPVYYADFAAITAGTYTPCAASIGKPRIGWEPIPEAALSSKPLYLRFGTVVAVDGFIGRYQSFSINGLSWIFESLKSGKSIRKGIPPTISSLTLESDIRIIQEDVLGHCYTERENRLIKKIEKILEQENESRL